MQPVFYIGVIFIAVAILGTASGGVGGGIAAIAGVVFIAFALIGKMAWGSAGAVAPAAAPAVAGAPPHHRDYSWLWFPLAALVSITTGCHYYWGWSWLWSIVVAVIIVSIAIWTIRQPVQAGEVGIGIARGIWWLTTRLVVVLRAIATVLWAIPVVGTILAWIILVIVVVGGFYLLFKYGFWPWWDTHCWIC